MINEINGYRIISEVGRGGMGSVYMAQNAQNQTIALKMMSAKVASLPEYKTMFDQEVASLKRLSNSSIVKIVGKPFSDDVGNRYVPMEFIEGRTLAQIIKDNGPYQEAEALSIFTQLLDAFTYIHGKSCIHRDVKPSNIMIKPDGSICVIDFGIAKDSKVRTGLTIGRIVGTDGYMSPEQANGFNIDHRTDIYSLGCLLHYMLTGTHAIAKKTNDYDTICAILENDFPRVADRGVSVTDRTQNAILKAVDKNMTRRFQTAAEFKEALEGISQIKPNYTITVGRANCDIILSSEYVSSHHLDVIWTPNNSDYTSFTVTISDHSTNGTGMDGVKLKHESRSFRIDNKSVEDLLNDSSSLPQVMIAGLANHTLNWSDVLMTLFKKMDLPTKVVNGGGSTLTSGQSILCFIVPVAGFILGALWQTQSPNMAKMASKLACFGLLLDILLFATLAGVLNS